MKNARKILLIGTVLPLALAGCNQATAVDPAPTNLPASSDKGVAFGLSSALKAEVLANCDSVTATATFGDGTTRTMTTTLTQAMAFADGLVHLENLPADTSCRIEAVFHSKDRKTRYTVTVQISVKTESVVDSADKPLPVVNGKSVVLVPVADAGIDEQDWNLGRDGSVRLAFKDGLALFDFGNLEALQGKRIVRARLHLNGWNNAPDSNLVFDIGTVSRGWTEGTGNWYYFDQAKANGYDQAYANHARLPLPEGTSNPALRDGIHWSAASDVLASWAGFGSAKVYLRANSSGSYPRLEETAPVDFDVTRAVQSMVSSGNAKALALRLGGGGSGLSSVQAYFFSREFNGAGHGPRLEIELGDALPASEGDSLVLGPVQDVSVDVQDVNLGLNSELRFYQPGSMALLDFGDLPSQLAGKAIARAELVLTGWQGLTSPDGETGRTMEVPLDLGTVSRDWREGSGDWYWFDGAAQNGFARAYTNWTDFIPPAWARNPTFADGATWSSTTGLREGFKKFTSVAPQLPELAPYLYPKASEAGAVRIDVTQAIKDMQDNGVARALALRWPELSSFPSSRTAMFFSKDLVPGVAPRLVVRFRK
ncbi:MAG: hypothetical protein RL318_3003 [Fibrobacterota bacterium]